MMRKLLGITVATATIALAGCQTQPARQDVSSRSVLDVHSVRPAGSRFEQPVQVATPPTEPGVEIAVDPPTTVTPTLSPVRSARKTSAARAQQTADKSSYTVKKGDTLYGIARTSYGDGKKWTLIASANPGLSPQSLKSGQTIVIP